MAKKPAGGLPRYIKTSATQGASPSYKEEPLKLPKDGLKGGIAGKGTQNFRHSTTKPAGASTSIGTGNAPKDQKNTTLGRSYIRTKPSK